jgi:hypothetical protein
VTATTTGNDRTLLNMLPTRITTRQEVFASLSDADPSARAWCAGFDAGLVGQPCPRSPLLPGWALAPRLLLLAQWRGYGAGVRLRCVRLGLARRTW